MKQNGFTLIELLIVLLLGGIIISMAIPVTQDFLLHRKVATETEKIVTILQFARNQATVMNQTLTLAPYNNSANWSNGFNLFIDSNNNHQYDTSEKSLYEFPLKNSDVIIHWSGLYEKYLLFSPDNMNNGLAGTFNICPLNTHYVKTKSIILNRPGRIRVDESEEICNT